MKGASIIALIRDFWLLVWPLGGGRDKVEDGRGSIGQGRAECKVRRGQWNRVQ